MDAFKEKIRAELVGGTVSINKDKFLIEHLVKSGKHKDIYTLKYLVVDGQEQTPYKYLLKVRYSEKTKEYEENMKRKVTCYGANPIENAEGKRINLYDGGLCQHFAPIINTNYIYKDEGDFIADYIIQERMWMSLEQFSQYNKLDEYLIILLYKMIMDIVVSFSEQGYVYTNFSPSSIMINSDYELKLVNTSYLHPYDQSKPALTKKIFSTASLAQLTGSEEEDPITSMYWNVLFTLYDLYGGNIMDSTCIKNCNKSGECIKNILIANRRVQIDNYNKSGDVPFFQYIHGHITNGDNMGQIEEAFRLLEDKSIYYSFCVMVSNTITRIVRFDAPKITRDTKFICEFDPTTSTMREKPLLPEPSNNPEESLELGPEPPSESKEPSSDSEAPRNTDFSVPSYDDEEEPSDSEETPSDSEEEPKNIPPQPPTSQPPELRSEEAPSDSEEEPSESEEEAPSESEEEPSESEEEPAEEPSESEEEAPSESEEEAPSEEPTKESKGWFGNFKNKFVGKKKDKKTCVHPYCQNAIDDKFERSLAKFEPPRKCFTAKICADENSFKEIMDVLKKLENNINVHIPKKEQDKWMELQPWWENLGSSNSK